MANETDSPAPVPPADDGYPPPPEYNDSVQEIAPADVPVLTDQEATALAEQQAENQRILSEQATEVEPGWGTGYSEAVRNDPRNFAANPDAEEEAAAAAQVGKQLAQRQQTNAARINQPSSADWRVRLQLAANANYLYKAGSTQSELGILAPLAATDGVIFPYTPTIDTSYQAKYQNADLVHSNYRGYFYQNSYVDAINMRCTFTAQSTSEADYLLATIHFLKSVTKMFYGQDPAHRGAPPPIVYLTGLGDYQFKEHSCVVSQFNYTLPADVDYVRARSTPYNNTNLESFRKRKTTYAGGIMGGLLGGAVDRLLNAGGQKGGIFSTPAPPALGQDSPTYVPTKIQIQISALPIVSRNDVSNNFSLRDYGSGSLLRGSKNKNGTGFW